MSMKIKWIAWRPIETVKEGERVFLRLAKGEKGNGELAIGMTFKPFDCYWTWGGPNSGSDIDEAPTHWAPLPDDWLLIPATPAKESK